MPSTSISTDPSTTHVPSLSLDHLHLLPSFRGQQAPPDHPFHLSLQTYDLENDPIINSAGPFSHQFNFSPQENSPLVGHGFGPVYSNVSLGTTIGAVDYQSPQANTSALQSAASTPQPFSADTDQYFAPHNTPFGNARHMQPFAPSRPLSMTGMPNPTFQFNSMPNASGPPPPFQTPTVVGGHVNPNHVFQGHNAHVPGHRHENMFSLPDDEDNEDEDLAAFADSSMVMGDFHEDAFGLNHASWDANLAQPFGSLPTRVNRRSTSRALPLPDHDANLPTDWQSNSTFARTHGSAASVSDIRNRAIDPRRQKIPRTTSTPTIFRVLLSSSQVSLELLKSQHVVVLP